jgi:hypothetical protein
MQQSSKEYRIKEAEKENSIGKLFYLVNDKEKWKTCCGNRKSFVF